MTAPTCGHLVGRGRKKRPCKITPDAGEEYCRMHIDHPERHVEAKKVTLHEHVNNAIKALGKIVEHDDEHKAADVIKAALGILDRTGHGPHQTISIEDTDAELNELLSRMRDGR
jgi:hypothetical protein